MSIPIDYQTIKDAKGKPAFAVVKYDDFIRLTHSDPTIPNDVVWSAIEKGFSLPRAWREYLNLTQKEVASRMGISQSSLSQIEQPDKKLRYATLKKLAKALDLHPEQLRE
jgi:predicted transcriptional regulator